MDSHIRYLLDSLRERLWVKPALYACLALLVTLCAGLADSVGWAHLVPDINAKTIEALVTIISASMLGVSTFAVASMVSAYAAASRSTTPRAFSLLVKDRASQNALSSFIGAFIFSVAGIVAIKVEYYGDAGRFVLFMLALGVMLWIVLTFVRWVDQIARLGRLENTIDRVEEATRTALEAWRTDRALGGIGHDEPPTLDGEAISAPTVGYVRHVDLDALQSCAEKHDAQIVLRKPPGSLVTLASPILQVRWGAARPTDESVRDVLRSAFVLDDSRTFAQDPRLGIICMSEIASRALSPAVNDPGTAIQCLSRLVKTLSMWKQDTLDDTERTPPAFDRVHVKRLSIDDLFEDAFSAIARDGAGCVEVGIRLQKSLNALGALGTHGFKEAARKQARQALQRAEATLTFAPDLERVRSAARLVSV